MSLRPSARSTCLRHFSSGEVSSCSSNEPRWNSSVDSVYPLETSVNAAFGNCSQTAKSSAVIASQTNLYIYRPGSVTPPTCCQVILLTGPIISPSPSVSIQCAITFIGEYRCTITHFDEAQLNQRRQIIRTDRRQFCSLGFDIAQRPAKTDRGI